MRVLGVQVPQLVASVFRRLQSGIVSYFDGPFLLELQGAIFIRWPRGLSRRFLRRSGLGSGVIELLGDLKDVRLWARVGRPVPLGTFEIAILVPEFVGRLGNNLVQLRNSIGLAREASLGSVWLAEQFSIAGFSIFARSIFLYPKPDRDFMESESQTALRNVLMVEANWYQPPSRVPLSPIRLSEAQELIRGALTSSFGFPDRLEVEDMCVIHYRTGDVFGPNPHKRYGPPPHSYYLTLLREWNVREVTLVTENPKDPMVLSLIEQLESAQIAVDAAEGDLIRDIFLLLSCTHLVSSQGTFSISLGSLNPHLTHFGYFESSHGHEFWHPMSPSCRKWVVSDKSGLFSRQIHHANWRNTEQQSELVRNYPISNLSVE